MPLPSVSKHKAPAFLIPFALFSLSLIINLSLINRGPYHVDCLGIAQSVGQTLQAKAFHSVVWVGNSFLVLIGALFLMVTQALGSDNPILAINLMGVVCGACAIPILYNFLRRVLGTQTAVFGALLVLSCPMYISLSTFGLSQIPAFLFLMAGLLFLAVFKERPRPLFLWLAGISMGLMGLTRVQDFLLMLPAFIYYAVIPGGQDPTNPGAKNPWARIAKFLPLIIIGVAAALPAFNNFHDVAQQLSKMILRFQLTALQTQKFFLFFSPLLPFAGKILLRDMGWGLAAFAGVGIILLLKNKPSAGIFLLLWICGPFFFYGSLFTMTSRYLLLSMLGLAICGGYALSYFFSRNNPYVKLFVLLSLFCLIGIPLREAVPTLKFRHQYALSPDFAHQVADLTEANATIIGADEIAFIRCYTGRQTRHWPIDIFIKGSQDVNGFSQWLNEKLLAGKPVYILLNDFYDLESEKAFVRSLNKDYVLEPVKRLLYEDWHHSTIHQNLCYVNLTRIRLRDH